MGMGRGRSQTNTVESVASAKSLIFVSMRILHLLHQYLPEKVGGTELYTRSLAQQQVAQGHSVAIFAPAGQGNTGLEPSLEEGVRVYRVGVGARSPTAVFASTFRHPQLHHAFARVLQQEQPDLVHIQHLMGLPTSLMAQIPVPYVVTLHDFWWVCANAQLLTNDTQEICDGPQRFINCACCALARAGLPPILPAALPAALPLAVRNRRLHPVLAAAGRLIAPSAFVGRWYTAHGVPAEKLVVVPHGLDYPAGEVGKQPALSLSKRPFLIGYIGGISPQKGVHLLLQAYQQLTNSELWVAGDTSFDPAYTAQLQQLATPTVRFRGKLDRAAIWEMLQQLDVLVVPSIWYETFCLVISEAFAAGVPVVAFNLGAMAERIRHGQDGLLPPPGNTQALAQTLRTLQQNPAQLAQLRAGIQPVPTMTDHAMQITANYESILSNRD